MFPKTSEALLSSETYSAGWYYQIELLPGIVTKAPPEYSYPTSLTRYLLKACTVEGRRCLDIGPMEGLISAVLCKRGAAEVIASDISGSRLPLVDYVRHYQQVDFQYLTGVTPVELPAYFREHGGQRFDLVVLAGVLYHALDLPGVLLAARALMRTGALMVVESWVSFDKGCALIFNDAGRFTEEQNTFWFMTVQCFDYLLRYFMLAPLDCVFMDGRNGMGRLAVVCRATASCIPDVGDAWMQRALLGFDYQQALRRYRIDDPVLTRCDYDRAVAARFLRQQTGTVDLTRVVALGASHVTAPEDLVLRLEDRY